MCRGRGGFNDGENACYRLPRIDSSSPYSYFEVNTANFKIPLIPEAKEPFIYFQYERNLEIRCICFKKWMCRGWGSFNDGDCVLSASAHRFVISILIFWSKYCKFQDSLDTWGKRTINLHPVWKESRNFQYLLQ